MGHVNEKISNIHHREAVMQLLMGLNDSFSHIRGQILLMDPIPFVEKVYSLIQDEKQRSVGQDSNNDPFLESTTLATKTMNLDSKTFKKGKEKSTCSHCGLRGHTWRSATSSMAIPLGYKTKSRANQVSSFDAAQEFVFVTTQQLFPFAMEQCQKLLATIGGRLMLRPTLLQWQIMLLSIKLHVLSPHL